MVSLREDLNLLRKAKKEAKQRKSELFLVKRELQSQRKVMRTLIGRKSRLRRRALAKSDQSQKRLEALVRQARSIKELVVNLEKTRLRRGIYQNNKDAQTNNVKIARNNDSLSRKIEKPMKRAKGKLLLPVVGRMIFKFGEKGKGGATHKGVTILSDWGANIRCIKNRTNHISKTLMRLV